MRSAVEARAAADLATMREHTARELAALRDKSGAELAALEAKAGADIAALEAKSGAELGEARDTITRLGNDLGASRADADALRQSKGDLEGKLAAAESHIASVEADLGTLRHDIADVRQRLTVESARAERSQTKWQADRQSLERAKDALAVALAQIEEAEARSGE